MTTYLASVSGLSCLFMEKKPR